MRKSILLLLIILGANIIVKSQDKKEYSIDYKDPKSVVNAVFYSAQNNDFAILQLLCDPFAQGDDDTKRICELSQIANYQPNFAGEKLTSKDLDEFVIVFKSAKISGDVIYEQIDGVDYAKVPFVFNHPEGDSRSEEVMKLVKRYGNWYIVSF
jgi:hypothetical protein